jgi:hypothetical protein
VSIPRFVRLCSAAALAFGLAAPALADEAAETESASTEDGGLLSRFSGLIQSDFTNVYFFRGILQERDGFIAQPWGELYFSAYSSESGFLRDVTFGAGVWASFHTEETLAEDGPHSLYETDWYPLISLSFAHNISLTTTYFFYTSPNGAFQTAQELNFKLAWDDSETFGRWALGPYVNFAVETHNTAFGPNEGAGVQMGVGPTLFTLFEGSDMPVTFTAPIELGLAIDDYYEEEDGDENTFGYLNFGLSASVPLAFIPETAGAWSFTLTGKGWYLSNTLAEANRGRSLYPQFIASLGVEF